MINVEYQSVMDYLADVEKSHGHEFVQRNLKGLYAIYKAPRSFTYSKEEYESAFNKRAEGVLYKHPLESVHTSDSGTRRDKLRALRSRSMEDHEIGGEEDSEAL